MDDDGKDVAAGQRGEVLVKGPVVTKGYHNSSKVTQEAFVDGWFLTGDIAEIRNGLVYIVDRKKVEHIYQFSAEEQALIFPGTYQIQGPSSCTS